MTANAGTLTVLDCVLAFVTFVIVTVVICAYWPMEGRR